MSLHIKGIGHYLPPRVLSNADLEAMVETSDEWIFTRTGIRERRIAEETCSSMGVQAGRAALAAAGLGPADLDALVTATCTPDMTMPACACLVQAGLGSPDIPAFDLNAACSGFVYAMDVCDGLLATGRYRNVLLACSERFSSTVNYKDRGTCILFGDGAGSLVLSREGGGPVLAAAYLGANGKLAHLLCRPAGGSARPPHEDPPREDLFVRMDGSEVFKNAVRGMDMAVTRTLERAGWAPETVSWLVPHQANLRLMESLRQRLGLPPEKVVVNIGSYGNTSAASIPIALSERQKDFKPGERVLCVAFGSGFTWGGLAIEWR